MIVVLDTNILVMILSARSAYHDLFQTFLQGHYKIAVSNEVLLEYEQILTQKYGVQTTQVLLTALHILPNVIHTTPYYHWKLIIHDPDDDKFVDCAIAANAHILVTEDKHFDILKRTPFPVVNLYNIANFAKLIRKL